MTIKDGVPYYKEEVSTWDSTEQNEEANTWTQEETDTEMQEEEFTDEELALLIIDLINEEREKRGIAPLTVNDELMDNAALRAEELNEYYSHTRPDGTQFSTVITVPYKACGENLSSGGGNSFHSADDVAKRAVDGWMNSPRAIMESGWESAEPI